MNSAPSYFPLGFKGSVSLHVYIAKHSLARNLYVQWNLSNTDTLGPIICVLFREVSSFQGANNTYVYVVGTWSSVLIREVSLIQGCPLRGLPLYMYMVQGGSPDLNLG